jgi:hypothetical protein
MKTIPLSLASRKYRGLVAVVDDEDYPALKDHRWTALWYPNAQTFYATRSARGPGGRTTAVRMHRDILRPGRRKIDHVNGNGLDNRRENLRCATSEQNRRNSAKRADASSRYKGVHWHKRDAKWEAQIMLNRRSVFLGNFSDEAAAARAYDRAAVKMFGEFARTNFRETNP